MVASPVSAGHAPVRVGPQGWVRKVMSPRGADRYNIFALLQGTRHLYARLEEM